MSETHAPTSAQEVGGDAQHIGEPVATSHDAAPPVVQAEIVPVPRARRESAPPSSRDNREAARQVRADRRKELLGIFFTGHTPGRLTPKREAAYRLLNRVLDPREHDHLRRLLAACWDAAQSTSTEGL